jgi:sulfate transport system ATP-binding protein
MTSVFVTHDQEEAFEVADEVVVMNKGRIEQRGTPQEVFEHPANPFVIDFLGNVNVFHARVQNGRASLGGLELDCPQYPQDESRTAAVYVRPHELDVHRAANGQPALRATVERISATGPVAKVFAVSEEFGFGLNVELSRERLAELKLETGQLVFISPRRVRMFMPDTPEYSI